MQTKRNALPAPNNAACRIPLAGGRFAIVDPDDFEVLSKFHWSLRKSKSGSYAVRKATHYGRRITIFMHRQIMGADSDHQVHHINHNRLDNRKRNLQLVLPEDHARIERQYRITRRRTGRSGSRSPDIQTFPQVASP